MRIENLQNAFLMNSDEVQGVVDEVVAQRLEQTLHQRHAQAVHAGPARRVLGLPGALLGDEGILYKVRRAVP